ncbi:MAG: integrase catalytic domain-containing protein, partial [Acidimicrobiales bacterium]
QAERSITADDVTRLLDRLVDEHGVPAYLRMDNGPEFAAYATRDWCRFNGSATTFIDPGSPPLTGQSCQSSFLQESVTGCFSS